MSLLLEGEVKLLSNNNKCPTEILSYKSVISSNKNIHNLYNSMSLRPYKNEKKTISQLLISGKSDKECEFLKSL